MTRTEIIGKSLPFLRPLVGMILDYAESMKPLSGKNTSVTDSQAGGKVIDLRGGGIGGAAQFVYAFDVTIISNNAGVTAHIEPGTVNQVVPDNVLEDLDVPSGDLSYVFVRAFTDGKSVQSCRTMISTSAPDDQIPAKNAGPTQVDTVVGVIDCTAPVAPATVGTYTPYRVFYPRTGIILIPVENYRVSVDDPEPGKLPYDIYYVWEVVGSGDYTDNQGY